MTTDAGPAASRLEAKRRRVADRLKDRARVPGDRDAFGLPHARAPRGSEQARPT